jgi:hypothetical protein
MEHTWTILEENVLQEHLGKTNVIKTIWFKLITTDDQKFAEITGRVNLNIDSFDNFTEYHNLDLNTKVNWIKSHAGDFYETLNIESITSQF